MLSIFFCATVVLHRHRLQVLRRIFAIIGSVFLLRSRPMLMFTSLLAMPAIAHRLDYHYYVVNLVLISWLMFTRLPARVLPDADAYHDVEY